MPSTREIAEVLWTRCLDADHKPGRVQFTKYLYLVDYCHWRFHGRQASDAQWMFYRYGPWAEEVHAAMNALATTYGFHWAEEEDAVLRFVRVEEPRRLDLELESFIQRVLHAFKHCALNRVLEFAYRQTEPMLAAKRGDRLDFATVPVDKAMPLFSTPATKAHDFKLSPARTAQLAALRERRTALAGPHERWQQQRENPAFREAMHLLSQQTAASLPADSLKLGLSADAVDSLGRE